MARYGVKPAAVKATASPAAQNDRSTRDGRVQGGRPSGVAVALRDHVIKAIPTQVTAAARSGHSAITHTTANCAHNAAHTMEMRLSDVVSIGLTMLPASTTGALFRA